MSSKLTFSNSTARSYALALYELSKEDAELDKNRLFFLDKIIKSFLNLVSKSKGESEAILISAKKLSAEEKEKITIEMSQNFKSSLNIDYKYDPSLIAGLIIQIGSVMVDASIKTKLKKLEKNMLEV